MRGTLAWAAVGVALACSGCGGGDGDGVTAAAPAVALPPTATQAVNGPVVGGPPKPLAVKLSERNAINPGFGDPPRAGMLFDLDSGEVLWSRNPTRQLPIASITKMMTALIVAERLPQHTTVRITKEALRYEGSGVGMFKRGKRIGLQTMLYGLMLASGNDAAIALSQRVSGTLKGFVAQMNEKAREMNLGCTRFSRPDGLQDEGNHSCPYDLAALAKAVLDNPRLRRIVRRREVALPFPIKGGKLFLYNHNPLLKIRYPGTLGVKTGYTQAAGHSLVAAVRRRGRTLGVVLLHSPNILRQSKRLFDVGFRAS